MRNYFFKNIKNQLNDIKEINIDNNKNKISLNYSKVLKSLNFLRKYNIDMNNTFYEIKENIVHG